MTAAVTVEFLNTQGRFPLSSQMVHYPIITDSKIKEQSQLQAIIQDECLPEKQDMCYHGVVTSDHSRHWL